MLGIWRVSVKTLIESIPSIRKAKAGSILVGTGFIPLDLVYLDNAPNKFKAYAGGTCGNVLSILAFLGWESYPIARNDKSPISEMIANDLEHCGVNTSLLSVKPTAAPPIVVQRIFSKPRGHKTHSFSWYCPGCGAHLPSYKAVVAKSLPDIEAEMPNPRVFFYDRVSRAALDLAKRASDGGSIVVFEPSMIGEPKLFTEALSSCHIFKYSQDRISNINDLRSTSQPPIEIETLGSAGLRYRLRKNKWVELRAYSLPKVVDTSGAGDWFTAGVLHGTCQQGRDGLLKISDAMLRRAIKVGQAMATWNCQFPAARGGMYGATWEEWRDNIDYVLQHGSPAAETEQLETGGSPEVLRGICCDKRGKLNQENSSQKRQISSGHCMTVHQGGDLGKALSR
jgi:sugar/nucleoside kinase (ribokinase family)